jgi:hypothetical protein
MSYMWGGQLSEFGWCSWSRESMTVLLLILSHQLSFVLVSLEVNAR